MFTQKYKLLNISLESSVNLANQICKTRSSYLHPCQLWDSWWVFFFCHSRRSDWVSPPQFSPAPHVETESLYTQVNLVPRVVIGSLLTPQVTITFVPIAQETPAIAPASLVTQELTEGDDYTVTSTSLVAIKENTQMSQCLLKACFVLLWWSLHDARQPEVSLGFRWYSQWRLISML